MKQIENRRNKKKTQNVLEVSSLLCIFAPRKLKTDMTQHPYFIVMFASVVCMVVTAVVLFAVNIPRDERASKLRPAKLALAIASMVMAVGNMVQLSLDPQGGSEELTGLITLLIGYAQAMLFTMTAMVLIRPSVVTVRRVCVQSLAIACADIVLVLSYIFLPTRVYIIIYVLGIACYVAQMALYTWWYLVNYRQFWKQITSYYEEEQIDRRLRWIQLVFWSDLAIGIVVMVLFFGVQGLDIWMTPVMAVIYVCYAVWFINYMIETPLILPAIYSTAKENQDELLPATVQVLGEEGLGQLKQWIQDKRYLDTEKSTNDIAAEVGLSVEQMHLYFRDVVGEEFRTWRIRRRVEEAKRLMAEHPDYSTVQIGRLSGFNDRSYFYQQFSRFTGIPLQKYRRQIADNIQL